MSRRSGFTLIEVLVSIVLTSVVSLLVYGVVQAARDTQERIAEERHTLLSALAMRLVLQAALTGAQITLLAVDTLLILENRVSARGTPRDRLTFVTSGDVPPLTPGADWMVTLEALPRGLTLTAGPRGIRVPTRILARLPGVTGLGVRVRHPDIGEGWSQDWSQPGVLPEAVELTYWTDSGPVGVPLTVSLPLGQRR